MTVETIKMTFEPAQMAIDILVKIANDLINPDQVAAYLALEAWRKCLATPAQIAQVETTSELEVDAHGACVSDENSDGGVFIQTWTWIKND